MKVFNYKDYTVNVCTSLYEWAEEFYDMPEDGTLEEGQDNDVMGFCDIQDKEISIFVPRTYDMSELYLTVAHEIGHCVECPPIKGDHEARAIFFETFYEDVVFVADRIVEWTK